MTSLTTNNVIPFFFNNDFPTTDNQQKEIKHSTSVAPELWIVCIKEAQSSCYSFEPYSLDGELQFENEEQIKQFIEDQLKYNLESGTSIKIIRALPVEEWEGK